MGIAASKRLKKQSEFQEVRRAGVRLLCGPFIFQALVGEPSSKELPKIGIIASRRVGNAVKRNYGKRVFRELFRMHLSEISNGTKIVVVLRSSFDRFEFADLEKRFVKAFSRVCASAGKS